MIACENEDCSREWVRPSPPSRRSPRRSAHVTRSPSPAVSLGMRRAGKGARGGVVLRRLCARVEPRPGDDAAQGLGVLCRAVYALSPSACCCHYESCPLFRVSAEPTSQMSPREQCQRDPTRALARPASLVLLPLTLPSPSSRAAPPPHRARSHRPLDLLQPQVHAPPDPPPPRRLALRTNTPPLAASPPAGTPPRRGSGALTLRCTIPPLVLSPRLGSLPRHGPAEQQGAAHGGVPRCPPERRRGRRGALSGASSWWLIRCFPLNGEGACRGRIEPQWTRSSSWGGGALRSRGLREARREREARKGGEERWGRAGAHTRRVEGLPTVPPEVAQPFPRHPDGARNPTGALWRALEGRWRGRPGGGARSPVRDSGWSAPEGAARAPLARSLPLRGRAPSRWEAVSRRVEAAVDESTAPRRAGGAPCVSFSPSLFPSLPLRLSLACLRARPARRFISRAHPASHGPLWFETATRTDQRHARRRCLVEAPKRRSSIAVVPRSALRADSRSSSRGAHERGDPCMGQGGRKGPFSVGFCALVALFLEGRRVAGPSSDPTSTRHSDCAQGACHAARLLPLVAVEDPGAFAIASSRRPLGMSTLARWPAPVSGGRRRGGKPACCREVRGQSGRKAWSCTPRAAVVPLSFVPPFLRRHIERGRSTGRRWIPSLARTARFRRSSRWESGGGDSR